MTYLGMKTVPNEEFANRSSEQRSVMIPCDELQCQMCDMKIPVVVDVRHRYTNESTLASFGSPYIMYDTHFGVKTLW